MANVQRKSSLLNTTWRGLTLLPLILTGIPSPVHGEDALESVQASARRWIDLRMETAQLESDWAWQRDLLESTRDALAFKKEQLQEELSLLEAQTSTTREQLEAAQARKEASQIRLKAMEMQNKATVDTLVSMRPNLPPRLSASLDLAYTSLQNPDLPEGERLQLISTVLNRCFQFNNTLSYSEEVVRTTGSERDKVMSVLYYGLGMAYALDSASGDTFLGRPTKTGWQWVNLEGAHDAIAQLIDIFNERAEPALVAVPLHMDNLEGY